MSSESDQDYADIQLVMTPMLDGPQEVIGGYLASHNREARCTDYAIGELRPVIEPWYRLLTLYDEAISGDHLFEGEEAQLHAWHLRLALASVAAGTSKMVLDAALAGLYTQGFALVRHMLETWQRMVYVVLRPDLAHLWFSRPDGTPNIEPSIGTVQTALRKDWHDKDQVDRVERRISLLSKFAHPTGFAVGQLRDGDTGHYVMGGMYDRGLSLRLIDSGSFATLLILQEISSQLSVSEAWIDAFLTVAEERRVQLREFHDRETV